MVLSKYSTLDDIDIDGIDIDGIEIDVDTDISVCV